MSLKDYSLTELENEIADRKGDLAVQSIGTLLRQWAPSPIGHWKVTTENDCEGKTIRELGVHYGHVADIALALSGECFYALHFEKPTTPLAKMPKDKVVVRLSSFSGTWNTKEPGIRAAKEPGIRAAAVSPWLHGTKSEITRYAVTASDNFFASFKIERK